MQERLLWRVEEQLQEALRVLPPHTHAALQGVRLWLDPAVQPAVELGHHAAYLPLQTWHLDYAALRGDMVLISAPGFIASHGAYNLLLHELAHAYDDRAHGFGHPAVQAAFEHARAADLYANAGMGAYAMTNAREYFAELTMAAFATRPTTPHHRRELEAFDPQGAAAIAQAWAVR